MRKTILSLMIFFCLAGIAVAADNSEPLHGQWKVLGVRYVYGRPQLFGDDQILNLSAENISKYSSAKKDAGLSVRFTCKGLEFNGILTEGWLVFTTPVSDDVYVAVRIASAKSN